jgi:hypothetical protein
MDAVRANRELQSATGRNRSEVPEVRQAPISVVRVKSSEFGRHFGSVSESRSDFATLRSVVSNLSVKRS